MYSHGCTGFAYAYAEGSLFYPRALPPKKYDPDETEYQETLSFYLQPLELTLFSPKLMANIPRSNSIWTTSEYSPLEYTLFIISSTRRKEHKPTLVHATVTKKSTLYRSILPPQAPFATFSKQRHSPSPTTGRTYQLTLHNTEH